MLRTLSGTITLPGGGALQSGILRATPVGTMPSGGGGALAPVPLVFSITDGVIASGPITGGAEYLFEVFDGNLRAVYPDFHGTVADIADPITWGDIYASANTYVPPDAQLADVINNAIAGKAEQTDLDQLTELVTSDHGQRIAALEASGAFSLEQMQDAVAAMLQGMGDADVTYDDTAGLITITTTNLTAEQVQDIVGSMTAAGSNVTVTYDDVANTITIASTGGGGTGDVIGPASAVDARVPVFSGTSGKTLADGGRTIAELLDRGQHTGTQEIPTVNGLQTALDAKATAASLTSLRTTLLPEATYRLEAMPQAYLDWLVVAGVADRDDRRIQWCVDRLVLSDDSVTTVRRSVRIIVGQRAYDCSAAPFQQSGSLGTYVHGTLYGACAQILIPTTGSYATNPTLGLTFEAEAKTGLDYSVVNGDGNNVHPLTTNAVIATTATPPAGEGGNYCLIGIDRSEDAYANTHLSTVIPVFEGVTFRAARPLTAFDASHAFAIQGSHFKADAGVQSGDIHNYDPRLNSDGTAYTSGPEIEFRKQSFGLKTPLLWNGSRMLVSLVETMGFRNGLEWNENLVVLQHFANYDYCANKLRGMSHVATLVRSQTQRCPIQFEAPPTNDWNGNETVALLNVYHMAGEAYHPSQFGNTGVGYWYNHVARIWDPNGLWKGDIIALYESPGELPADGWTTLTAGHGGLLQIRRQGEAWGAGGGGGLEDVTPTVRALSISAGVTTITPPDHTAPDRGKLIVDGDTALTFSGWQDGDEGEYIIAQSGAGHTITWGAAPSGFTLASEGTLGTFGNTDDHVDLLKVRCRDTLIIREIVSLGTIAGYTDETGSGGPDTALPTLDTGTYLNHFKAVSGLSASISGGAAPADGGRTGVWAPATGPAGHALVATADTTVRPVYRAAGQGGHPYLEFTAADSNVIGRDWAVDGALSEPCSLFVVGAFRSATSGQAMCSSGAGGYYESLYLQGAPLSFTAGIGNPVAADLVNGSHNTNVHVFEIFASATAGADELVVDGTAVTGTYGGTALFADVRFGANSPTLTYGDVDIYEIVAISNPSTADRTANRSRLRTKYGV